MSDNGNGNGNGVAPDAHDFFSTLYYGDAGPAPNGHVPMAPPQGQGPRPSPQAPPGHAQMPAISQRPSPAVYAAPPPERRRGPEPPSRLEVDSHRLSHNGRVVTDPRITPHVEQPQLPTGAQGQFPPFAGVGTWPLAPGQDPGRGQAAWTPGYDAWPHAAPPGYGTPYPMGGPMGQVDVGPQTGGGGGGMAKIALAVLALGTVGAGWYAWRKHKAGAGAGEDEPRENWSYDEWGQDPGPDDDDDGDEDEDDEDDEDEGEA